MDLPQMLVCFAAVVLMNQTTTKLVLLGTGTPRLDPERFGPSAAVVVDGVPYVVDCGPGVVRRTAAAFRHGEPAFAPKNLSRVFITHLHSDHTLGYPDLIFSPWVVGRDEPLQAYGPKGLAAMTDHIEAAYSEDIAVRTDGLEHGNKTGYKVEVHEIEAGEIYRDEHVTVTAFPVHHGAWKYAFGYKFKTADRTIVFSGDTNPNKELEKAATGADVLVHEVYALDEASVESRPGGQSWVDYLHDSHTSAVELGQIAARAKPKLLVLTHVLRHQATDQELIDEVRKGGFEGQVVVAKDLDEF